MGQEEKLDHFLKKCKFWCIYRCHLSVWSYTWV